MRRKKNYLQIPAACEAISSKRERYLLFCYCLLEEYHCPMWRPEDTSWSTRVVRCDQIRCAVALAWSFSIITNRAIWTSCVIKGQTRDLCITWTTSGDRTHFLSSLADQGERSTECGQNVIYHVIHFVFLHKLLWLLETASVPHHWTNLKYGSPRSFDVISPRSNALSATANKL